MTERGLDLLRKVLVIAAHPDDEILGCGGTIRRHIESGDEARAVIMCEGESLRYKGMDINQRRDSMKAQSLLGYSDVRFLDFPDQKLDTFPYVQIIAGIESCVGDCRPDIVYCQSGTDVNKDHQITFDAAMVALRPKVFISEIYTFYTVGSTEWGYPRFFCPDTWVELSEEQLHRKIAAFQCYHSEQCEYPHPRSPEALVNLAKVTGNQCCMEYAESFKLVRKVNRIK